MLCLLPRAGVSGEISVFGLLLGNISQFIIFIRPFIRHALYLADDRVSNATYTSLSDRKYSLLVGKLLFTKSVLSLVHGSESCRLSA